MNFSASWRLLAIFLSDFLVPTESIEDGAVRIAGDLSPLMGYVEIYVEGRWGRVYNPGWGNSEATVVCRQLGLSVVGSVFCCDSYYAANEEYVIYNVNCHGNESEVFQCAYSPWDVGNFNQYYRYHANVVCSDIRLVGSARNIGRVEVHFNGSWMAILDNTWDAKDASVVCNQLMLPRSVPVATATNRSLTRLSDVLLNETSWVCDVQCSGGETSLSECTNSGWGTRDCDHYKVAEVSCEGILRLVSETGSEGEGRVEVFHENRWGSVCDDSWDDVDASVVCNQLGYGRSGKAVPESLLGKGSGAIWMDEVECLGNESSIVYCKFPDWNRHDCSRTEIAGVICNTKDIESTPSEAATQPQPPPSQPQAPTLPPQIIHYVYPRNFAVAVILAVISIALCIALLFLVVYLTYVVKWKLPLLIQSTTMTDEMDLSVEKPQDDVENDLEDANAVTNTQPNEGHDHGTKDTYNRLEEDYC